MKRVKYACLEQTLHFMLKEDLGKAEAMEYVRREVEVYKRKLEQGRTRYRIVEEGEQPDGSVIIKIKKQYNQHDCGDYLN